MRAFFLHQLFSFWIYLNLVLLGWQKKVFFLFFFLAGLFNSRIGSTGPRETQHVMIFEYFEHAILVAAYDLATQCPSRRASMRRHTVVVVEGNAAAKGGSLSVPQSRPASRQTNTPTDDSLSCTLPEMTWSRTSLQDDLFKLVL